jgi:hypothetical protein
LLVAWSTTLHFCFSKSLCISQGKQAVHKTKIYCLLTSNSVQLLVTKRLRWQLTAQWEILQFVV